MTDFEKAVGYLCLLRTEDTKAQIARYEDIEAMVHGDDELIEEYSRKYEKMFDLLD